MVLHHRAVGGTHRQDPSTGKDAIWAWREASMPESAEFTDFIRRIRAGEDEAARDRVARYEPIIRREVRVPLRDPRL